MNDKNPQNQYRCKNTRYLKLNYVHNSNSTKFEKHAQ